MSFWIWVTSLRIIFSSSIQIGNFEVGKQFDAVVVDMDSSRRGVNAPVEEEDSTRRVFDKFLMTGDDRNIVEVYVNGRKVYSIE